MKIGWWISIVGHISLIFIAFLTLKASIPDAENTQMEALAVNIDAISDLSSMRKGDKKAPKKEKAALQEKSKEKILAKETNPQKSKLDTDRALDKWAPEREIKSKTSSKEIKEVKPEEKIVKDDKKIPTASPKPISPAKQEEELEKPKLEEKAEISSKSRQEPEEKKEKPIVAKPKQKPIQPTKTPDDAIDKLIKQSLLIDKTRTRGGSKKQMQSEAAKGGDENIGKDEDLAMSLADKISSCVRSKFNVIALGGGAYTNLKIRARFTLNEDGSIDSIDDLTATGGDSRLQEVGINQARAALKNCAPFKLPPDKYQMWHEIDMIFDPYSTETGQ